MTIMPPAIRRVPEAENDEGRYVATFILDDDASFVRFVVHLDARDDDPKLTDLEEDARQRLKSVLQNIVDSI